MTTHAHAITRAIGDRLDGRPLLVMLDVDGTLAPIAPTPEQAAVPPATLAVLRQLGGIPGITLGFVSGRAAADTWRMTGVDGAWVAGNHGIELRRPDGDVVVDASVLRHEADIAAAAQTLQADLASIDGAIVENKRWTISVHYRLVADADVARLQERSQQVASERDLRVLEGKKIVELRPPADVNKGTAVRALLQHAGITRGSGSAMYVGDDRTDEDAFGALRDALPGSVTVRVDAHAGASPTLAEFSIGGTEELRALLEWIVVRRSATHQSR